MKLYPRSIQSLRFLIFILFGVLFVNVANAASKVEIDIKVKGAVEKFQDEVSGGKSFLQKAEGILIFPDVVKAGFGIGGEIGDGALLIKGKTVDYYNTAAASIGFQIGLQFKTVVLVFLKKDALDKFRNSNGWEVGVDGSVALIELGAGVDVNTINVSDPIVGFVFSNKGLMYNLTLEGSKITKLDK
jgi:lipid-binding SYLF domain-containing protein